MKKLLTVFTLMALFALSACSTTNNDETTLTIATSSGFPPYEMTTTDGELEGFDIDLGNALGEALGYDNVKWVDMDFDSIVGTLGTSTDIAIAGMSPNPERDATYSINYFEDNAYYVLTTKDSKITSRADLAGKIIGVQTGTTQELFAEELVTEVGATLDSRSNIGAIVQEILIGRIDVLIMEKTTVQGYADEYPDTLTTFELDGITEEQIAEGGRAIYMPKGSDLEDPINQAIQKLIDDGTIDAFAEKWFASETE